MQIASDGRCSKSAVAVARKINYKARGWGSGLQMSRHRPVVPRLLSHHPIRQQNRSRVRDHPPGSSLSELRGHRGTSGDYEHGSHLRYFWRDAVSKSDRHTLHVASAPAPAIPAGETVWIEDSVPAGATTVWGPWTWGQLRGSGLQISRHNPCNPPREIMLHFLNKTTGSWNHRAYWGADLIAGGTAGTVGHGNMGALPQTGQWVRLEGKLGPGLQ